MTEAHHIDRIRERSESNSIASVLEDSEEEAESHILIYSLT